MPPANPTLVPAVGPGKARPQERKSVLPRSDPIHASDAGYRKNTHGPGRTGYRWVGEQLLFAADVPPGFEYRDGFLTPAGEAALVESISCLELDSFEMRGVVARRRVKFFGSSYGIEDASVAPMPAFLDPLRNAIGDWAGIEPGAFAMALINEYRPGTPIGWHRDAPQYDIVCGVSLLSACRMRFRPYTPPKAKSATRRTTTHEIALERRSAYIMRGESRTGYEHHIPAVESLRYSITFRTLR